MTTPTLHPDFRALIESLTRHGARFVIVGAHAMAVLGRARQTDDLDVLVEPTADNARRVAAALRDFAGFERIAEAAEEHLTRPTDSFGSGTLPFESTS